ncbi:MAG: hypothetical protein GWN02_18065, partial [Gemmatimonadetes bacterium]|nr:hypothetical protein [Gemmatimonadota bacterium]
MAEDGDGEGAMIEQGRLISAWSAVQRTLVPAPATPEIQPPEVPPSMADA